MSFFCFFYVFILLFYVFIRRCHFPFQPSWLLEKAGDNGIRPCVCSDHAAELFQIGIARMALPEGVAVLNILLSHPVRGPGITDQDGFIIINAFQADLLVHEDIGLFDAACLSDEGKGSSMIFTTGFMFRMLPTRAVVPEILPPFFRYLRVSSLAYRRILSRI